RPFFNWLYRHYMVSDVINLNGFKLYNRQGAVERTMLILVNGRKPAPEGVAPTRGEAPHLYDIASSFEQLWERIKPHVGYTIDILIKQLKIELHDLLQ
ncbi:MAG: SAM-dependent DNA methyltransferase, partial [Sinomicrobium sp.]|nr:SAM-dependent DNA methyltransferase [Sinomicrobium sp.]